MIKVIICVFVILHGLVHLLYFGQSWGFFRLEPNLVWPKGSWAFSRFVGNKVTKILASISCILVTIGFVFSSIAIIFTQKWWDDLLVYTTLFSTLIFILFWDGKVQKLHDKGGIGILINIAILISVLIFQWPDFDFNIQN